jgi:HK97 family phage major capsid protein
MSLQALREQRAAIATTLQALVNREDYDPAVHGPEYEKAIADIDGIDARMQAITAANEAVARETRTDATASAADRVAHKTGSKGAAVYAKWLRGGDGALNQDDWAHVRNTMSTTTGSQGAFTVDSEVATSVIDRLRAFGGMRSVATVIQTSGFGAMSFPTSDGTTEEGEIVAENVTVGRQSVTFGTVGLPVFKFSSLDVAFVNERLITRIGRITNRMFTTGSGSGQPNGIATAAVVGVTAANSTSQVTAVTYDSLVNLQHSVDPAYRAAGGWMFNDTTLREIRKIRDGQQRPIFVPGYETTVPGGAPDRLLGAPITVNQDVADMGASARSILFGDFSGYYIRDVMSLELYRFTDSAFARNGQVGFLAMLRTGGNLIDVNKVRVFVNAAS